ncbi:MAG: DUF6249 domain-containing protein [Pseudomonadota bacterium]
MKLKNFISSRLRQAAIASVLVAVFALIPASAVELTGTPTAVGAPTTLIGDSSKVQPSENAKTPGHVTSAEQMSLEEENDKPLTTDEEFIEDASVENKPSEESIELVKEPNRHLEAMSHPHSTMGSTMDLAEILIPITAISFSIGGAILLIIVLARLHYRDKERRAQNNNANIDRLLAAGRDIPIELLRGDEPYADNEPSLLRDNVNLHKGLRNVCLGVGLFAFLSILCGIEIGAVGFILIGLGISQLLVWKLSGVKTVTKGQD